MEEKEPQSNDDLPLNDFQKTFDDDFTKFIHSLPNEFVNYLRKKLVETQTLFEYKSFQLELVVDTNILFSEVRSLVVNQRSFFLTIADNPTIKIYAPSQLKKELHEKIKIKFPKDKQTKNIDINECISKADLLLSKVTIRDDFTETALEKAKSIILERDGKDVSFVALNFSLKSHGVLTRDKDISEQTEVKTWDLKNAGKVVSEINKGTCSMLILNASLPPIWEAICDIATILFNSFIKIVEGTIILFSSILAGSVEAIINMPQEMLIILGIAILLMLIFDNLRDEFRRLLKTIWEEIKKIIRVIIEVFKAIWEVLKAIFEALKPILKTAVDLIAYFSVQSTQALKKLEELEAARPQ